MIVEKIEQLNNEILDYAFLIEKMIEKSMNGFIEKDKIILEEVLKVDEENANKMELKLDEMLFQYIAQFEPKAKDLRRILMMLKMNNDLERIGDHCVNISESALFLIDYPKIKEFDKIFELSDMVKDMLENSIDAFLKSDTKLAYSVCENDNLVDHIKKDVVNDLIEVMIQDSKTIQRAMHLNRISSNLERIADLATNISEDVIFIEEGKVIKHHSGNI